MQESIVFLVCVQCRRKESSRSLSHLMMSFLLDNQSTTACTVWPHSPYWVAYKLQIYLVLDENHGM